VPGKRFRLTAEGKAMSIFLFIISFYFLLTIYNGFKNDYLKMFLLTGISLQSDRLFYNLEF